MFAWGLFLILTNVSGYLIYKISAWKGGCTISVELQIPQTSMIHFGELLQRSTKESKTY